jgi:hypothetical protein
MTKESALFLLRVNAGMARQSAIVAERRASEVGGALRPIRRFAIS